MLACAVAWATLAGCREEKPQRTYREPLEGTAEAINLQTGEVTMLWHNPKKNSDVTLTGRVTEETEYFINGRSATLADIRLKEQVRVTGYVRGKGIDKEYMVTRVDVEREEDWIPTSAPTTQPARQIEG